MFNRIDELETDYVLTFKFFENARVKLEELVSILSDTQVRDFN